MPKACVGRIAEIADDGMDDRLHLFEMVMAKPESIPAKAQKKPATTGDVRRGGLQIRDVFDGVSQFFDRLDSVFAHVADPERFLAEL